MKLRRDNRNRGHLSCPKNRDTADLSFESHTFIGRALHHRSSSAWCATSPATLADLQPRLAYRWSLDNFLYDRKMVQPLLYE